MSKKQGGYNDVNDVQRTLTSVPAVYVLNIHAPRWLIIANNLISGSATGTNVSVGLSPVNGPTPIVEYGTVKHFYMSQGLNWFNVSGDTANITVIVCEVDVIIEVSTGAAVASTTSNVNVTNTNIDVTATVSGTVTVGGSVDSTIVNPLTPAGSVKTYAEPS